MAFFNEQSKDYQACKDAGKYDPHATNQSTETNPEVTQMLDWAEEDYKTEVKLPEMKTVMPEMKNMLGLEELDGHPQAKRKSFWTYTSHHNQMSTKNRL